jgi:ribosomal protein S18 acetylase RimI-like enzyme
MHSMTVRTATNKDALVIADLSRETFYNAFASANTKADMDKFMNEVFTREKLMAELDLPNNIFLLAFNGDEVAGYARLRDKSIPETTLGTDNILEIVRIYAVSSETGKGTGSVLMNESIARARKKNREYIWLGVWEKNERAIRFYERFGFKKFGEHDFILGNDVQTDWLMMLKIN